MRSVLVLCVALGVALGVSGCVPGIISKGHDFDMAKAEALTPGVTTIEEARAIIGQPFTEETSADGSMLVKWVYAANGVIGVHGKGIAILFGPDHKMVRITKQMDEN